MLTHFSVSSWKTTSIDITIMKHQLMLFSTMTGADPYKVGGRRPDLVFIRVKMNLLRLICNR